jgi:hypothetical protein
LRLPLPWLLRSQRQLSPMVVAAVAPAAVAVVAVATLARAGKFAAEGRS